MPNVEGAYCSTEDLRTGDIAPPSYTTKEQYVSSAAEEIDAALGHLYVTPVAIDVNVPQNRPSILFLKKINWLLASGRFVLDVAAAGELDTLHSYGKRMLDEATVMMKHITSEELVLAGAEKINSGSETKGFTGPMIHNEDSSSLVEGFYQNYRPGPLYGPVFPAVPVVPYG